MATRGTTARLVPRGMLVKDVDAASTSVGLGHRTRDQLLAFGYVAEPPTGDPLAILDQWSRAPRRDERSVTEPQLVREGLRALRAAFAECLHDASGRDQVVFLSGGLDSRTILGALLELYRPAEIVAATFGRPGERDFDIAADVASAAGVRHEVLDSFSVEWTTPGLVSSVLARGVPTPKPFGQRYLSYQLHRQIGDAAAFWDGLCGDLVGGAAPGPHESWDTAVRRFFSGQLVPGSERFLSESFTPARLRPAGPFCSRELLSYREQVNFAIRQSRYVRTRLMRGYLVSTPFLRRPWLDFMLRVPERHREGKHLYRRIQEEAFPRLFELPSTHPHARAGTSRPLLGRALALGQRMTRGRTTRGSGPRVVDRGANSSLQRGQLDRADLRQLVEANIDDLAGRALVPGLDAAEAVRAHADGELSARMAGLLVGLELNLKAAEQQHPPHHP